LDTTGEIGDGQRRVAPPPPFDRRPFMIRYCLRDAARAASQKTPLLTGR